MILEDVDQKPKEVIPRVLGGMSWPEDGNPAFLVLVTERRQSIEESLEPQLEYLEIINEIEGQTIRELTDQIEEDINIIYVSKDKKYFSYIRDFNIWRREENEYLQIRPTASSSFESGIIKIKDFIRNDKIVFPDESKVREQLKIFSDASFKTPSNFYAVVALSNAICSIRERIEEGDKEECDIKAWH